MNAYGAVDPMWRTSTRAALTVRWTIVAVGLGLLGAVASLRWADTRAEDTPTTAMVRQETIALDIAGDLGVYGPRTNVQAPWSAVMQGIPASTALHTDAPEVAVRVAALEAQRGDTASAAATLRVPVAPELHAIAAGFEAAPGSEELSTALDAATSLKPLWARRALRLALLERAGDSEGTAREESLAEAESGPRVALRLSLILIILLAGLPSPCAFVVALALGLWVWLRRQYEAERPHAPLAPLGAAPVLCSSDTAEQADSSPADRHAGEVASAPSPPPRPAWGILEACEVLLAFFLASTACRLVLALVPFELSPALVVALTYCGGAVAAAGLASYVLGPGYLRVSGHVPYPLSRAVPLALLAAYALPSALLAVALTIRALGGAAPVSENPVLDISAGDVNWLERIVLLATVGVAAPLVEETLFRGVLYVPLRRGLGAAGAIVASSLVFGLVHFDFAVLPMLGIIGLACAILREATGSLKAPMVLHGVWNSGALVVLTLAIS